MDLGEQGRSSRWLETAAGGGLSHSAGGVCVPGAAPRPVSFAVRLPRLAEPPRDLSELTGPPEGVESKVG